MLTIMTTMTEAWPDGDGLQLGRGPENRMTMTEAWPDGDDLLLGRGPENRMIRMMMTMNDKDKDGLARM